MSLNWFNIKILNPSLKKRGFVIFMNMKPFIKYIKQLDADEELLDDYRQLRYLFQEYGWSEKDLEKPPYYTQDMMSLYNRFGNKKDKLMRELKTFFGNVDVSEVSNYLEHKMREINQEIPLDKKED